MEAKMQRESLTFWDAMESYSSQRHWIDSCQTLLGKVLVTNPFLFVVNKGFVFGRSHRNFLKQTRTITTTKTLVKSFRNLLGHKPVLSVVTLASSRKRTSICQWPLGSFYSYLLTVHFRIRDFIMLLKLIFLNHMRIFMSILWNKWIFVLLNDFHNWPHSMHAWIRLYVARKADRQTDGQTDRQTETRQTE